MHTRQARLKLDSHDIFAKWNSPQEQQKRRIELTSVKETKNQAALFLYRLSIACVHLHIPRQKFAPTHSLTATLSEVAPGSLDDKKARYAF